MAADQRFHRAESASRCSRWCSTRICQDRRTSECLLLLVIKHAWQLAFKAKTICEWGVLAEAYDRCIQRKHTLKHIIVMLQLSSPSYWDLSWRGQKTNKSLLINSSKIVNYLATASKSHVSSTGEMKACWEIPYGLKNPSLAPHLFASCVERRRMSNWHQTDWRKTIQEACFTAVIQDWHLITVTWVQHCQL